MLQAYLAANASGDLRSQIGSHVPVGTNYVDLPPETPMDGQGWKIRTIVTTSKALVSNSFLLLLVRHLLLLAWHLLLVAMHLFLVASNHLRFVQLSYFSCWPQRDQLFPSIGFIRSSKRCSTFKIPVDTPITNLNFVWCRCFAGVLTNIVVYTKSALVEQTTPTSMEVNDTSSSVSNIVFLGHDVRAN